MMLPFRFGFGFGFLTQDAQGLGVVFLEGLGFVGGADLGRGFGEAPPHVQVEQVQVAGGFPSGQVNE